MWTIMKTLKYTLSEENIHMQKPEDRLLLMELFDAIPKEKKSGKGTRAFLLLFATAQ